MKNLWATKKKYKNNEERNYGLVCTNYEPLQKAFIGLTRATIPRDNW